MLRRSAIQNESSSIHTVRLGAITWEPSASWNQEYQQGGADSAADVITVDEGCVGGCAGGWKC